MLLRPSGAGSRPAWAWPAANRPAANRPAGRPLAVPGVRLPVRQVMRQGVRLAVDAGSVRIGVARSDPDGILASPLAVVRSGPGALDELARLAAGADAIEVVVGLPTSLSGRDGAAAATARSFAADLAGRIRPVPVRLFDERFTTAQA